jgi:uncharacterized RDD family membrane protein YckC
MSEVMDENQEAELASPGQRLLAFLFDVLVCLGFVMAGIVLGIVVMRLGHTRGRLNDTDNLLMICGGGSLGWLLCFILQAINLSYFGQTFGKGLCKIKIVRITDGQNGGFGTNVVMRSFLGKILLHFIPLYSLVDFFMIFSEGRRCLHDRIAETKVVKV